MKIKTSHLWREPNIILSILKNFLILDPTVLFDNPKVYYIKQKQKIVCFAAIKKHGASNELKSVYTLRNYRNKGYMTKLMNCVLKKYPFLYLTCKSNLISFYKRFGFVRTKQAPRFLMIQKTLFNLFIKRSKNDLVILKKY